MQPAADSVQAGVVQRQAFVVAHQAHVRRSRANSKATEADAESAYQLETDDSAQVDANATDDKVVSLQGGSFRSRRCAVLVLPVGRDAKLSHLMHFLIANLYFDALALRPHHAGMK